jgi:hypothetical protein
MIIGNTKKNTMLRNFIKTNFIFLLIAPLNRISTKLTGENYYPFGDALSSTSQQKGQITMSSIAGICDACRC